MCKELLTRLWLFYVNDVWYNNNKIQTYFSFGMYVYTENNSGAVEH